MNDEGCPETLDEVVDKTLEYLPDDVKIEIAQMNEDDLICQHRLKTDTVFLWPTIKN